jgi:hypothetical protein
MGRCERCQGEETATIGDDIVLDFGMELPKKLGDPTSMSGRFRESLHNGGIVPRVWPDGRHLQAGR